MQKGFLDQMQLLFTVILFGCLVGDSAHAQVNYLALGDSFTSGVGVRNNEAFPRVLVREWSALGCSVTLKNKAWGGRTARGVAQEQLKELTVFKPDLVTLGIGANDIRLGISLPDYLYWVRVILHRLEQAGIPAHRIWVFPQPSWHLAPVAMRIASPHKIEARIKSFNKNLKREVLSRGMRYLEIEEIMKKQAVVGFLAPDLFHPSALAYQEWASWMVQKLPSPCMKAGRAPYRAP